MSSRVAPTGLISKVWWDERLALVHHHALILNQGLDQVVFWFGVLQLRSSAQEFLQQHSKDLDSKRRRPVLGLRQVPLFCGLYHFHPEGPWSKERPRGVGRREDLRPGSTAEHCSFVLCEMRPPCLMDHS